MVLKILRLLFWFAVRLAASAVAGLVGGVIAYNLSTPEFAWTSAPVGFFAAAAMLWASRNWGAEAEVTAPLPAASFRLLPTQDLEPQPDDPQGDSRSILASDPLSGQRTGADYGLLLEPDLQERLRVTEAALVHASRDQLGQPAAEWLAFWRRRVPDLIAAAKDVWDDADAGERTSIAKKLSEHLDVVISEAEARLAVVKAARLDLFTIRANHAAARVRDG